MNAPFQCRPQATEDLDAIWWFIAEDNRVSAGRVEMEIVATCRRLAKYPRMGTMRQDITPLPFWNTRRDLLAGDLLPAECATIDHLKRTGGGAIDGGGDPLQIVLDNAPFDSGQRHDCQPSPD
jgi:plasmid stabilization system protein ParE